MGMQPNTFEITALQILAYVHEHETAQDPLEHVVDYWVKLPEREYIMARVQEVVQHLVLRGILLEVGRGGRVTYKLNPEKREEVSVLLSLLRPMSVE
jgi:hypothetical protein